MTWDQYWYGDVQMVKGFREADRLRQERVNAESHLQGLYFYEALCDVAPVLHAFARRGTKPRQYAKKPYGLSGKQTEQEGDQEREDREEKERIAAKLYMQNMVRAGKGWGKK